MNTLAACPAEDELERVARGATSDSSLASHLANCSACRDYVAEARQNDDFLRGLRSFMPLPAKHRIGAYEIERVIGAGGMGTVYLGRRADDAYEKRVAIKVIRDTSGDDSRRYDDLLRRFRNERQTLAGLEHPNIARLLDGGASDDGLPYLVMEFVDGRPIDVYCDRMRLSTSDRLRLFRSVCAAVHYSHQNLIMHRDLKPGNILVTADGTAKLLDFGLAKLVDPAAAALAAQRTQTAVQPMTPAYASPEQVRGDAVTTASDIYSLGVVLYELLTGRHPHRSGSRSSHELARLICEQEPDKPSTAVTRTVVIDGRGSSGPLTITPESTSQTRDCRPERLRRRLAGDIDTIVLKALRKEPQRRYGSVEQLSEDIRRHLDGRPVRARRDTWSYRSAKFVARHRAAVIVAAVAVLALFTSLGYAVRWANIATTQRDTAERLRDEAERLRDEAQRLRDVAQRAQQQANASAQRAAEAAARAAASIKLVQETLKTLRPEERGVFRAALDAAGRNRDAVSFANQPELEANFHATMGDIYRSFGLNEAAETHLQLALQIRRSMFSGPHLDVAQNLNDLAETYVDRREFAEAEPLFVEALEMRRELLGTGAPVVASLTNLASLRRAQGKPAESEQLYREALETGRASLGDEHPEVVVTEGSLAILLRELGKLAEAESLLLNNLATRRKLYGNESLQVATSLNNLAMLMRSAGRLGEAEPPQREALEIARRLLPADHPYVASGLVNLARILHDQKRPAEAEPLLREYLAMPSSSTHALGIAQTKGLLGACLCEMARYAEAESLLREGYEQMRDLPNVPPERVQEALQRIVELYDAWGRPEAAAEYRALLPQP